MILHLVFNFFTAKYYQSRCRCRLDFQPFCEPAFLAPHHGRSWEEDKQPNSQNGWKSSLDADVDGKIWITFKIDFRQSNS